jgi:DNA-binding GntR family transcriptional regulator
MATHGKNAHGSADDDAATVATRVAELIRDDIIRGNFEGGERLNEGEIAKHYGVSRIPLREALRIVEGQGLIEIRAFSGAFVSELSIAELIDIFEIHEALESMALRLALPMLTSRDLDVAAKIARKFEREPDPWRALELSNDFYTTLYGGIGRRHLLDEMSRLLSNANRYLFAYFAALRMYQPEMPRQRDYVEVLRKRNVDKALEFQRNWRRKQREFLIRHMGEGRKPGSTATHRSKRSRTTI